MGILLAFMFIWNMVGALTLVPALSYYLLRGETRRTRSETANERPVTAVRHTSDLQL
jgi:hypothetical protein